MKKQSTRTGFERPELARLALLGLAATLAYGSVASAADDVAKGAAKNAPKTAAPTEQPLPGNPVLDRKHLLAAGDVISIMVDGHEEWSKTVRLFQDGTFELPAPIGLVKAENLTTEELKKQIRTTLLSELKRPSVNVELREIYVKPKDPEKPKVVPKIMVLGAVSRRGELELPDPKWLRAVLQEAAPTEKADLAIVKVKLPDGTIRMADFSRYAIEGTSKDDMLLKGGEEITIVERPAIQRPDPIRVQVLGQVHEPTAFEIDGEATILEILKRAGGAKPGADLERVKVSRPAEPGAPTLTLNVEKLMFGDTSVRYVPRRGDTITVPEKALKVFVFGEVATPGETAIRENENVKDLWLQTKVLPSGDLTKAQLIRRGADGKPVATRINFRDYQKLKIPDSKLPKIQPGDALFIPHRTIKRGPLYYLSALTSPLFLMQGISGGGGYGYGGGGSGYISQPTSN